jgi:hypothetical protein
VLNLEFGMPDDDRFSRYLTPAWKRVLRSLQGREPAERVADNLTTALAATMRDVHGVPMLPQIAERMQDAAIHGTRFEKIARRDARHVPTELAERAAAALAVTMQRQLALVSPAQATLILARKVVTEVAYHYGFDRMLHKLLKDEYTPSEVRLLFAQALAGDQVTNLTARFVARPTGNGLRAPDRKLRRLAVTELLDMDLEAL